MNSSSVFYSQLASYLKAKDKMNANRVIMSELGNLLAKNREDFIEVLKHAHVSVPENPTDLQLVDLFIENAPYNNDLLLGASFLVNYKNQVHGFDGEKQISDGAVKACYKTMRCHFDGSQEESSNAGGGILDTVLSLGKDVTGKVMDAQHKKNFGASDSLAKQQDARRQMIQSIIEQRKQQQQIAADAAAAKKKNQRLALIIGGSALGLLLIIGAVVIIKSKK